MYVRIYGPTMVDEEIHDKKMYCIKLQLLHNCIDYNKRNCKKCTKVRAQKTIGKSTDWYQVGPSELEFVTVLHKLIKKTLVWINVIYWGQRLAVGVQMIAFWNI